MNCHLLASMTPLPLLYSLVPRLCPGILSGTTSFHFLFQWHPSTLHSGQVSFSGTVWPLFCNNFLSSKPPSRTSSITYGQNSNRFCHRLFKFYFPNNNIVEICCLQLPCEQPRMADKDYISIAVLQVDNGEEPELQNVAICSHKYFLVLFGIFK